MHSIQNGFLFVVTMCKLYYFTISIYPSIQYIASELWCLSRAKRKDSENWSVLCFVWRLFAIMMCTEMWAFLKFKWWLCLDFICTLLLGEVQSIVLSTEYVYLSACFTARIKWKSYDRTSLNFSVHVAGGHGSVLRWFLPRNAMLSAVYAIVVCLSVCVCVCLSHSGIVSKRLNVRSRK